MRVCNIGCQSGGENAGVGVAIIIKITGNAVRTVAVHFTHTAVSPTDASFSRYAVKIKYPASVLDTRSQNLRQHTTEIVVKPYPTHFVFIENSQYFCYISDFPFLDYSFLLSYSKSETGLGRYRSPGAPSAVFIFQFKTR